PPSIASSPQPPAVASPSLQHHPPPVTIPTNHPLHHATHRPLPPPKGALVRDIHKEWVRLDLVHDMDCVWFSVTAPSRVRLVCGSAAASVRLCGLAATAVLFGSVTD
nr:hypothetical protein [Tanacetum cinerariifolium]